MWPAIIGLVAFLVLLLILGTLFAVSLLSMILNGIVLYLFSIRMLAEVNKGWLKEYGLGALLAFIVIALTGNVLGVFWMITTYVLFWFVAAQLVRVIRKK